jgi:hypothetical protein
MYFRIRKETKKREKNLTNLKPTRAHQEAAAAPPFDLAAPCPFLLTAAAALPWFPAARAHPPCWLLAAARKPLISPLLSQTRAPSSSLLPCLSSLLHAATAHQEPARNTS